MFKKGDRVRKKNGDAWKGKGGKPYNIVTVDYLVRDCVYAVETGTWIYTDYLELACDVHIKREELTAAIKLIESYELGATTHSISGTCNHLWHKFGRGHSTVEQLLDLLLPLETEKDLEIERIEGEMRKLADDLAKVKA